MSSTSLALAAAVLAGCGAWRLRGTTLVAPALWAASSLVAVGGVELLAATGLVHGGPTSPLRYAAAVTVLCPMMAVLGAKRPQDRAWQWVVVALLATLWLPAANVWIVGAGEPVHLSLAWRVFVLVLVLLGPLNYLPTGNWLPALVAATGQGVLLAPFVAPTGWSLQDRTAPVSLSAFLAAAAIAWLLAWIKRGSDGDIKSQGDELDALNAAWLRFRNAFGAFWAVRVLQRVNQGVESIEPPVELTWHGWKWSDVESNSQLSSRIVESSALRMRKLMDSVLRRFVRRDA